MKRFSNFLNEVTHFTKYYLEWGYISINGVVFDGNKSKSNSHGDLLHEILQEKKELFSEKELEFFKGFTLEKIDQHPDAPLKIGWIHWYIDTGKDFDMEISIPIKRAPKKQVVALLNLVKKHKNLIKTFTVSSPHKKEQLEEADYTEFLNIIPEKFIDINVDPD